MNLAVLVLLTVNIGVAHADTLDEHGIPDWILPGILAVESRSYYTTDGAIVFVDRRMGKDGELGCFQITRAAFDTVRHRGERFGALAGDTAYSERIAARYLLHLHKQHCSWVSAIMAYNTGKTGTRAGRRYLNKLYRAMGMHK